MIKKIILFAFIFTLTLQPFSSFAQTDNEHLDKAVVALSLDDYYQAIEECDLAIKITPNLAIAYAIRARAYLDAKEYNNVIADCTKAIELNMDYAEAYAIRALAYFKTGDIAQAEGDTVMSQKLYSKVNVDRIYKTKDGYKWGK